MRTSQPSSGLPGRGVDRRAGPVHHHENDLGADLLDPLPGPEARSGVGTDDQVELDPRPAVPRARRRCRRCRRARLVRSRSRSPRALRRPRRPPRTSARRSAAGVTGRLPTFCQGSFATTSRTRSRSSSCRAFTAATRWPTCTGSKVPPRMPSRPVLAHAAKRSEPPRRRPDRAAGLGAEPRNRTPAPPLRWWRDDHIGLGGTRACPTTAPRRRATGRAARGWHPASGGRSPAAQQPPWPDPAAHDEVLAELAEPAAARLRR